MGLGMWMMSSRKRWAEDFGIWKKGVSWDLDLDEASWFFGARLGQTSCLRQGAARGGSDGKVSIERNCVSLSLSPHVEKL